MPDQNVDVTFDPAGKPQFTFDDETVEMTAAGKVILHRRPEDAQWKFKEGFVKEDTLKEFSSSVHGNGRELHIDDKFLDKSRTPYDYRITVELRGTIFTSPDPVIVNDPGR